MGEVMGIGRATAILLCSMACLAACAQQAKKAEPVAVAVNLSPEEQEWVRKGDVAKALGKKAEAIEAYEQAAGASHGAVRAHLELAEIYANQGEAQKSLDILTRAHTLNPSDSEVLKELSYRSLEQGKDAQAESYVDKGLAISPDDVRLLSAKGILFDRKGQHTEAQAQYQKALAASPASKEAEPVTNNLALSLIASGKAAKAVSLLEGRIANAREKTTFRQTLALAYGVSGDEAKARELGKRDLSESAVNENLEFYRRYRAGEIDPNILFQTSAR